MQRRDEPMRPHGGGFGAICPSAGFLRSPSDRPRTSGPGTSWATGPISRGEPQSTCTRNPLCAQTRLYADLRDSSRNGSPVRLLSSIHSVPGSQAPLPVGRRHPASGVDLPGRLAELVARSFRACSSDTGSVLWTTMGLSSRPVPASRSISSRVPASSSLVRKERPLRRRAARSAPRRRSRTRGKGERKYSANE